MLALCVVAVFVVSLAIGVPISISLGASSVIYFFWQDIPGQLIVQRIFAGIDNFILLAIPFFMFAGRVMNEGTITERIVDLSKAVTGSLKGGLAMVNVIASMLFAGISGAAAADVASVGAVLIPAMKKDGYTPQYSVAVTSISAIIGPIIPPSVVFILYGVLSGTSIIALFLAGFIPGILLGLSQIMVIYFESRKKNFPAGAPTSLRNFSNALSRAALSLVLPLIIIGGMLGGVFTATEAGAVASLYALILSMVIYRKLRARMLLQILKATAIDTANVMVILGTSTLFAWMLASAQVPEKLGAMILSFSDNQIVIMIMINLFLLAIGTFMDNFPAMIITVPVLLPIVKQIGVSPLHFGVIMTVNLMIGTVTPPVGMTIYLGSAIGKTTVEGSALAMKWLLLVSIALLFLITYVPWFSMFLPGIFGLTGN